MPNTRLQPTALGEPNAPEPKVFVEGTDVVVEFEANA
jgi:hypothetical protein